MGLNCKPIGKDKSVFTKQANELAKKAVKVKKSKEKNEASTEA